MKPLLTILFAAITFSATAQTDSTHLLDTTIVDDGISKIQRKSLAIQPIVVNMAGDTAHYLHWKAFDVDRADTSAGMGTLVSLIDRKGKTVATFNVNIPAEIVNEWALDPKPIDDFILEQHPRIKRKF